MVIYRKYNTTATIDGIPLITRGAVDYKANPTLAAGDVTVSKDGGAFANIATLPVVTPTTGTVVQVSLSTAETSAKHILVRFIDQTATKEWEDQSLIVETYGSTLAQITSLDNEFIEKWINNRLIESPDNTWKLYDDDSTVVLRTWVFDPAAKNRAKATT